MKRSGIFIIVLTIVMLFVGCGKPSVAFDAQNDSPIFLEEANNGKSIEEPKTPSREGYRFLGWYTDITDGERWDFSQPVTSDVNLYARWEKLEFPVVFTIDPKGDQVVERVVGYGGTVEPPKVPEYPGYRFLGWYANSSGETKWDMEAPVTQDAHVHAKWEELRYALAFAAGKTDVAIPETTYHTVGSRIRIEDSPVREIEVFTGWNTKADGTGTTYQVGDTLVMGTEDVVLYAQWSTPMVDFDAGSYHAMVIRSDGSLIATGNNSNGQLGDGARSARFEPMVVAQKVKTVSSGGGHSLFIDTEDVLWGMGANYEGQLGIDAKFPKTTAVEIMEHVESVSAGGSHTMVLTTDGVLYTMGNNEDGQLGDGSHTNRNSPVRIADGVKSIAAGLYHSTFLAEDGTLWTMGWNEYGQLGTGTHESMKRPVKVADDVVAIAAGGNHTLFLKDDGSLWAMGDNGKGQLGTGGTEAITVPTKVASNATSIASGETTSFFFDGEGYLWAAGSNESGQLPKIDSRMVVDWTKLDVVATKVTSGADFTLILDDEGTLRAFGSNDYGQLGTWEE
jgi:uncharacterized repeat protein (TIGR02543 family)